MKTFNITSGFWLSLLLTPMVLISYSKKNDEAPSPMPKKKITITAKRKITQLRNPALGNEFRIAFSKGDKNEIYTFDRSNSKFMSYNMETDSWSNLKYTNQFEFAGYSGKMLYTNPHTVLYITDQVKTYFTKNHSDPLKKDSWGPNKNVTDAFSTGGAGGALSKDGTLFYSAGGKTNSKTASSDIRKYHINDDSWEEVSLLTSAYRNVNATIVNEKMYIIGERIDNGATTLFGSIFNLKYNSTKNWKLPLDLEGSIISDVHQLVSDGRDEFLFFYPYDGIKTMYIYNLKKEAWETSVKIEGDFISGRVNLFVMNDILYAAGSKDGNLALYEIEIKTQDEK